MKIDFKKLIIRVLVFSVLLVAFYLVYYYGYFLPQKELELEIKQIELERQQEQLEKQLEEDRKEREGVGERNRYLLGQWQCIEQAYDVYIKGWNRTCERLGKEKGCGLSSNLAERWDEYHKELEDECFRKYPQD